MAVMSTLAPVRRRGLRRSTVRPVGEPSLAGLERGVPAVVVGVSAADPATERRLLDLGFVPGTPVEMVRRAPLRDPVVFRVAGYEIALRRAQAQHILVAPQA